MAKRKANFHVEPRSIAAALLHNARVFGLSYAVHKDTSANETKYYLSKKELLALPGKIRKDFQKHSYRNRRMPSNATPIREAVMNLEAHHTFEDVERAAKAAAKKMGVQILAISIHRDEGKDADNLNYHAHILLNYFDFKTHRTVHHYRKDKVMQQVQTIVAKELEMVRGSPSNRKHIPHYEYREVAKMIDEAVAPHIKNASSLKKEIENLRKQMISLNKERTEEERLFSKEDYRILADLKKRTNKKSFQEVVQEYYELLNKFKQKEKEDEKSRRDRHSRDVADIDKATESIHRIAREDFGGIAEACQTKQASRFAPQVIRGVAENLTEFSEEFQRSCREITDKLFIDKIEELKRKSEEHPKEEEQEQSEIEKALKFINPDDLPELSDQIKDFAIEKMIPLKVKAIDDPLYGGKVAVMDGEQFSFEPSEYGTNEHIDLINNCIAEKVNAISEKVDIAVGNLLESIGKKPKTKQGKPDTMEKYKDMVKSLKPVK